MPRVDSYTNNAARDRKARRAQLSVDKVIYRKTGPLVGETRMALMSSMARIQGGGVFSMSLTDLARLKHQPNRSAKSRFAPEAVTVPATGSVVAVIVLLPSSPFLGSIKTDPTGLRARFVHAQICRLRHNLRRNLRLR